MSAAAPTRHPDMTGPDGLASIDAVDLILARVRILVRLRVAWLQHLGADSGADALALILNDLDHPAVEHEWRGEDPDAVAWERALADIETALAASDSRYTTLCRLFGLDDVDADVLQACLALAADASLGLVFARLQGDERRGYVTGDLVARLLRQERVIRWPADSPLRRWELVIEHEVGPGEPPVLACDRAVRDWLLGHDGLDPLLLDRATLRPVLPPLQGWPVAGAVAAVERAMANDRLAGIRVIVSGPPDTGRRTFAAAVAAELGLPLLAVDTDGVDDDAWHHLILRANRHALLNGCALAWHGTRLTDRPWPLPAPAFPIQFFIAETGQAAAWRAFADHAVEMPMPSVRERRELWSRALPHADRWPASVLDTLAARHRTPVGAIAAIARHDVPDPDAAIAAARRAGRQHLGPLAQLLECPFRWEDLVVADDVQSALEELVYEARERVAFWERSEARRLFPEGRGLLTLFTGSPGTGKTMAAQVIAAQLGLDLLRIDLSAVVSKYVGETSQNLERILTRARHMDAVLLFDEADALFGRRTEIKDAHDRFANTDTNYLLQAVEAYPGVALLATNRKANMDPAFFRRLRYVIDFPIPDAHQRARIWSQVVAGLAGKTTASALDAQIAALADGVEATGAQIKFATLAGVFMARREGQPLVARHLVRGMERELAKDGRALSVRERERLVRDGR